MADLLDRLKTALADRYAIERELGSGGMATVYLAEDLKHHRMVAVKVLRPELAATLGADRFLREIEIAAQLQHPHILTLIDSGEADGLLYYVMPYVEGESLRNRLEHEIHLPIDEALKITGAVASALYYAHHHNIIHRDIKPENILLSAGEAVVADFGIARAISAAGGESLTEAGMAVGTPAYMSPEQASGARQLDGRSDIYSLACVLYEMLAGEPPFTGPSGQAITARKLSEPVPGLRTVRETVPATIEQATMRALAKVPADRFATASQFAEALAAPTTVPATEPGPQRTPRGVSPAQRRAVLSAGALVGVLLLALGLWARWGPERFSGPETPADSLPPALPGVEPYPLSPKIVVIPLVVDTGANMTALSQKITDRLEDLLDSVTQGQRAFEAVSMVRPTAPAWPVEEIRSLTIAVGDLVGTGSLNRGQWSALVSKLNAAARELNQDNPLKAATLLQAFGSQVNAYMRAGILAAGQGQVLIDAAQNAVDQLSG